MGFSKVNQMGSAVESGPACKIRHAEVETYLEFRVVTGTNNMAAERGIF